MPQQPTQDFPALLENLVRDFTRHIEELVRLAVHQQLENAISEELRLRADIVPTSPAAPPTITATALLAPAPVPAPRKKRLCPVPGCGQLAAGPKYRWRCRQHKNVSNEEIAQMRAAPAARESAAQSVPSASKPEPTEPTEPPGPPAAAPLPPLETGTALLETPTPPLSTTATAFPKAVPSTSTAAQLAVPAPGNTAPAQGGAPKPPSDFPVRHLPPGPSPYRERRDGRSMECRYPGCPMKSKGFRYDFFCWEHYQELNKDQRAYFKKLWQTARAQAAAVPVAPAAPAPVIVRRAGHEAKAAELPSPQASSALAPRTAPGPQTGTAPAEPEVVELEAATAPVGRDTKGPPASPAPTEPSFEEAESTAAAEEPASVEDEPPVVPTEGAPAEAESMAGTAEPTSAATEPAGASLEPAPFAAARTDET